MSWHSQPEKGNGKDRAKAREMERKRVKIGGPAIAGKKGKQTKKGTVQVANERKKRKTKTVGESRGRTMEKEKRMLDLIRSPTRVVCRRTRRKRRG